MAQHLCEMTQIGHVATVRKVGENAIVRIASNANFKNGEGKWVDRTYWNDHTIFGRQAGLLKWATGTLQSGDLVVVRSTPFQTEWETRDGDKRYGQTFAVNELNLLCAKADRKRRQQDDAPAEMPLAG